MHKLHYKLLEKFNSDIFSGFITENDLAEMTAIGGVIYWLIRYNKKNYLLKPEEVKDLPIEIQKTESMTNRSSVYHKIESYYSVNVTAEHTMSPRELIQEFMLDSTDAEANEEFTILAFASALGRVNFRVIGEPGFGKDSLFSMINSFTNDIAISNPRTVAAVEYRLNSKVLVLNEMSNLKSGQRQLLQNLMLMTGDYKSRYEKSSRKTKLTQDVYDISNLSQVVIHNPLWDYILAGQKDKYFDKIFTNAVLDRFMPFAFTNFDPEIHAEYQGSYIEHDGKPVRLDMSQFSDLHFEDSEYQENLPFYKKVLREIKYLRENYATMIKGYDREFIKDFKLRGRHRESFYRILDFVDLYAEDEDEFNSLAKRLYQRYLDYYKHVKESEKILNNLKQGKDPQEEIEYFDM